MERDMKLKEFAAELFSYIYRDYNATFELPVKLPHVFSHHAAGDFTEDQGKAVLKLCVSLRSVFGGVITKAFPQIQQSVKHFMTFLTSQCLKLCGDDLFLSFLMICAFIAELNLFCWINGCFAYMNTGPKCLIAIFNRRLRKEFYASGGWEGLKLFCETFVQTEVKNGDGGNLPLDYANGEFINQELLDSVEELLDQNSSSDSDDSEEDSDSEEEGEVMEDPPGSSSVVVQAVDLIMADEDSVSSEETDSSEDMDSDSEEEEDEAEVVSAVPLPNNSMSAIDDDEEDESSDVSDTSSMSGDEESESDSESDEESKVARVSCIKSAIQEHLNIEKQLLN